MNGIQKYFASTTPRELGWSNSDLLEGDVAEAVRDLKEQPGRDMFLIGSGELASMLMQHDFVDEYKLVIHPITLDWGKRLFRDEGETSVLKLVGTKMFDTGVLFLTYQPAGKSH